MRRSNGLTLLELLIALAVLSVGIVAGAAMQTTALRTTNRATVLQQGVKIATAELEMQRQLATPANKTTCLSGASAGYTCEAVVVPRSVSGTALTCASTVPTGSRVAYRVTVTISGPLESQYSLTSLILLQSAA